MIKSELARKADMSEEVGGAVHPRGRIDLPAATRLSLLAANVRGFNISLVCGR